MLKARQLRQLRGLAVWATLHTTQELTTMMQQLASVNENLARIAGALERLAGMGATSNNTTGAVPDSPWVSPNVPTGFDTVLGYFSNTYPSAFALLYDPIGETQRDGYWLTHQAKRRDLRVVKVAAPQALIDMGVDEINAYPIELLEERIKG